MDSPQNKPGAPQGNTNRQLGEQALDTRITISIQSSQRHVWRRAAQALNDTLGHQTPIATYLRACADRCAEMTPKELRAFLRLP